MNKSSGYIWSTLGRKALTVSNKILGAKTLQKCLELQRLIMEVYFGETVPDVMLQQAFVTTQAKLRHSKMLTGPALAQAIFEVAEPIKKRALSEKDYNDWLIQVRLQILNPLVAPATERTDENTAED